MSNHRFRVSGPEPPRHRVPSASEPGTVTLPIEAIWVHADAARLEQVFVNLLSNAAKYTNQGGHDWLTLQQMGEEALLRVQDTGVDIAPETLPLIFDLFTQAQRTLDRSKVGGASDWLW
jgi:signal transduction histidine kinase